MPSFADLPFANVLHGTCSSSSPPHSHAMARNLLSEHRLSTKRLSAFSAFAGDMLHFDQIQDALENYQIAEVRPLAKSGLPPAYERLENANNVVELSNTAHLATVLDLTRLGYIYAEAWTRFKIPEFKTYAETNPRGSTEVNDFLAIHFNDPGKRETFLEAIFLARSEYRRQVEERVRPTWAATWISLQPFLDPDKPERWLQAVGVPKDQRVWVAVLRYPVKNEQREIKLYRPTQLDAGWYAHHFPSPPQSPLTGGGLTMFLQQPDQGRGDTRPLVSEFLHTEIDFSIHDWHAAGGLLGCTRGPVSGDLEEQRRGHWLVLQSSFGPEQILQWMPEVL